MKEFLDKIKEKINKSFLTKLLPSIYVTSDGAWISPEIIIEDDKLEKYFILFNKKFTLDEIDFMFDSKPTKSMVFSILKYIDFNNSSRSMILSYLEREKIEICYLLVGAAQVQFTKSELDQIIDYPSFETKRSIPMSGESIAKANKYRLLKHQDAADEEIFYKVFGKISNTEEKESILRLLKEKKFAKKIEEMEDSDSVKLFVKLQT
jgi:hypothetical protein